MFNDDTEEQRFSGKGMHRSCKRKSQLGARSYSQGDEMAEERRNVSHQQGKTLGRRGEVKQEEIDKEIVRRNRSQQQKKKKNNKKD
jgi:hypothetical protein